MHEHAYSKVVAETVRERRKQLHLTQENVADLAGCSIRFLQEIEYGKPSLRLDKLVAVLRALGLELALRIGSGAIVRDFD